MQVCFGAFKEYIGSIISVIGGIRVCSPKFIAMLQKVTLSNLLSLVQSGVVKTGK